MGAVGTGQSIAGSIVAQGAADPTLVAKASPKDGEELRFDDLAGGDLYIGAAADGAATSAAVWKVARYYRTATGTITRLRFRTGVVWDSRQTGWS